MTFPESLSERNAYILDAVRNGKHEIHWVPVKASTNGHSARFWVNNDALKIEGCRVIVSAFVQQQIADLLGASLLTTKLADLIYEQAEIILVPHTMPITFATSAMLSTSAKIDKDLVGKDASKLISTVGKHWCICDKIKDKIVDGLPMAMNYGWHVPNYDYESKWNGIHVDPWDTQTKDSSGKLRKLVQSVGTAHSVAHTDYSQNCVLVLKVCEVDGKLMNLYDILQSDEPSALASCHGKMNVLRQPGVPIASNVVVLPEITVTS
jgi:hypothetical protein